MMEDRIIGVRAGGGVACVTPAQFRAPGSVFHLVLLEDNYMGLIRGGE